ncbi:MAG: hypothetical protein HY877_03830 [Deltaproteobacteria bacterium]|nr:hypothetical protein [Deltaproteobacteria bacterium]
MAIGKTKEESDEKETALKLGDDFLGEVYVCLKPLQKQYPLLWMLVEDFYRDVFFSMNEAKQLEKEVGHFLAISPRISNDSIVWLHIIKNLCQETTDKDMTLFCDAD